MIDPRFANAGAVPLVPGFGTQQVPVQYHHHRHHHHRHHKNKTRNDESPLSRDESIHKVDHGQQNYLLNNDMPLGTGYGVPYTANGFGVGGTTGFHQQQQFNGGSVGYNNQYTGVPYGQGPLIGAPAGQTVRRHRRHRRHHRQEVPQEVGASDQGNQEQPAAEPLIGRRSTSDMSNREPQQARSPAPLHEGAAADEPAPQHRRRGQKEKFEQTNFEQANKWNQNKCHTTAGPDGYGHINDDLIFIERGDHSPHRQEPPPGFEYKGKIEVQGIDRESRSRSHGSGAIVKPSVPVPQPSVPIPQPAVPTAGIGSCPPGWQQMVLTAAPGGPCPPGALSYTGQPVGGTQAGFGGFGSMGSFGVGGTGFGNFGAGFGGGFGTFGAATSLPAQCQFVADYLFGSNAGANTSTGTSFPCGYQSAGGTTVVGTTEQTQIREAEEHVSDRPTVIEVWQRRSKSKDDRSHIRRSSKHADRGETDSPSMDLERFRKEILNAIERMVSKGSSDSRSHGGRDGGTQTHPHPTPGDETHPHTVKTLETGSGEVRVIVQPVQPVFYMPRQTDDHPRPIPNQPGINIPPIGPTPPFQQPTPSGGANVVYVPRNVYVPVIKPVFVPRERVIVRPQVIHVARPVLVDRPVPVTQRPIIIDRERPIPVPVRSGRQEVAQSGEPKVAQEEFVYRDNLPVAYGGRCPEFSGGANYGYMPTQQEHQYASSSTHEASNIYQTQAPSVDVNVQNQFQQSETVSQYEGQQAVNENFNETYTNLAGTESGFTTEVNNECFTTQQEQQYTTDSTHETENIYQTESRAVNVNVPNQYQHAQSASHLAGQNMACETFEGSYSDLVESATTGLPLKPAQRNQDILRQTFEQSAQLSGVPLHDPTQIEILDMAVNPNWQKTDQSTLVRRYGRPAFEIVNKSKEAEQQMYNELRQRASNAGIARSSSTASYGSGSGFAGSNMVQY